MRADERLEPTEWERRLKTTDGPAYSYSLFLPDRIPEDAKSAVPVESRYESVADYDAVLRAHCRLKQAGIRQELGARGSPA